MLKGKSNYFIEAEVKVPYARSEIRNVSVNASSADSAIELYKEELKKQGVSVSSISKKASAFPGIACFLVTLIMSFFRYFEKDGFSYVYLYPNIISVVLSVIIYSSFVIRVKGIENTFKNVRDTVLSILFILVFAIFVQILTKDAKIPSGAIGKFLKKFGIGNSYHLIIAAIVLSWLGIKQVCGFIWLAVFALALTELMTCGEYMGNVKGSIFILSAFLGFVFFLKYEGKMVINSFKDLASKTGNYIKSDLDESKQLVQTGVSMVSAQLAGNELSGKKENLIEGKDDEE